MKVKTEYQNDFPKFIGVNLGAKCTNLRDAMFENLTYQTKRVAYLKLPVKIREI
jgi:hypothetical protein